MSCSIVWFRKDLRLADNPALMAAVEHGQPVIPLFIWLTGEEGRWTPGAAGRWWLHQSLRGLQANLRRCGSRLILQRGLALKILRTLASQTKTDTVFWNRRYEPVCISRDEEIRQPSQIHTILKAFAEMRRR